MAKKKKAVPSANVREDRVPIPAAVAQTPTPTPVQQTTKPVESTVRDSVAAATSFAAPQVQTANVRESRVPAPTVAQTPVVETAGTRQNLGITEALLNDPEYGPELKKIFDLWKAGKTTEAIDELYKTKFGRLRPEAQARVLERAERSEIYKENLRQFVINTRKALRLQSLDATDQELEAYYVKGTPFEIIQDDIIKKGPVKAEVIGGAGLDNLTRLQTLARKNGVSEKSLATVLGFETMDDVLKALASGEDITVFERKIRNYGATAMPDYIKNQIASGLDLEDAVSPYRSVIADELEIPVTSIDVTDKNIQDALANNMNLSQFRRSLRKDPRWQYTNNAKDIVRNSLAAVLQGGL